MITFKSFSFLPTLQATLLEKGFKVPTEIQERALPILMAGKSLVGVSETGSGKTLAYALPVLHFIKSMELEGNAVTTEGHPRAVVLVPTRELGEQVSKVFKPFTHTTRLRVRTVLGGTTFEVAKRNVSGAFEILVATPGRLIQLLERNLVNLSDVKILVFDEADQMLDQGFLPDATQIVSLCPPDRQMVLFSATVTSAVQKLIKDLFSTAEVVRSEGSHRVVATLKTTQVTIENGKRFPALQELLAKPVKGGTLIFVNTRAQCDKLAHELETASYKCVIYRGEMDKVKRRTNLKTFREGSVNLLVATDLASRGLDIEHVGRVINYHMPSHMENYLHRVGRTARAGRKGMVFNFVTERDLEFVETLKTVRATEPRASGNKPEKRP